jgi:Protein of unknown function (DUF1194)
MKPNAIDDEREAAIAGRRRALGRPRQARRSGISIELHLVIACAGARMGVPAPEPPMKRPLRLLVSACTLLMALAFLQDRGEAAEVDLALVLAVDVSNSMDPDEQELQRQGFVEAFRSPLVHDAVRKGVLGRVAVTYMEWAGSTVQHVVVPWTEIEAAEDALGFADQLARAPIRRAPRTSISGGIDFSVRLLAQRQGEALRQVIDVSGDGANNQGRPVAQARDEAVAKGITINGLPLLLKRQSSSWDVENLDEHYRDCVIGGSGAFLIPVRERAQFAAAIRTKIVREIAGREPGLPIVPAQAQAASCQAGENPYWERWRN